MTTLQTSPAVPAVQRIVLVADDTKDDRKLVQLLLRKYDCTVVEAASGKEALELARKHKPRVVVLDHRMPEMTGYEAIQAFRADLALASVPIILLTSRKFDEGFKSYMQLAGVEFLRKPVESKQLLSLIQKLTGELPLKKGSGFGFAARKVA